MSNNSRLPTIPLQRRRSVIEPARSLHQHRPNASDVPILDPHRPEHADQTHRRRPRTLRRADHPARPRHELSHLLHHRFAQTQRVRVQHHTRQSQHELQAAYERYGGRVQVEPVQGHGAQGLGLLFTRSRLSLLHWLAYYFESRRVDASRDVHLGHTDS